MALDNRRFRTVTLDMGFTLVDLVGRYDRALLALAALHGREITLDDVRAAMRATWERQFERDATATWTPSPEADRSAAFELDRQICLHLGFEDPAVHAEAHAIAWNIFHDPSCFHVFPEVWQTLEALRRMGLTLGIISNWGWQLPELCAELGLAPYFDFVITSARVGAAKPHPAIFQEALRRAGSRPAETLHVGDSLAADILGAEAAGITGVLIDRTCPPVSRNGHPVICGLDQLLSYLEES